MKNLNKKGFTLVELLAVIVVLALLMVVAASSIGTALNNSKKKSLETEAQKLYTNITTESKSQALVGSVDEDEIKKTYPGTDGDYIYEVTINNDGDITALKVCYGDDYYVKYNTTTKELDTAKAFTGETDDEPNCSTTGSVTVSAS